MCSVSIKHKDKQNLYILFVVPGNGPVLLWMLDIELLDTLNVRWSTKDAPQQFRILTSRRAMQHKQNSNHNSIVTYANSYVVDYLLPRSDKEADKRARSKLTN